MSNLTKMNRRAAGMIIKRGICIVFVGSAAFAAESPKAQAKLDKVTFVPMEYRDSKWYGSAFWTGPDWTRVGKNWQHSGQATASVRCFRVPRDGQVAVSGRVYKLDVGGNGIRASILLNAREVWKAEINGDDEKGVEPKLSLQVKAGDAVRFVLDKRGDYGSDTTAWDPVVSYGETERYQASEAFAALKQGAGGWFYETTGEQEPSPYKLPETLPEPPVARLTTQEAQEFIRQDWLAQRGAKPCVEACREELERAERILKRMAGRLDAAQRERWEKALAQGMAKLGGAAAEEPFYLELRQLKRALLLSDPEIDFSGILCIDNGYAHGSESLHEIRHRNEDTATPGGRLLVLEGLGPDAAVRKLAPQGAPAAFWRPDLSFDGKRVLYCMKAEDQRAYHLYETGLDGSGFRQLTEGDYNDLDAVYAPDGGILFTTSRCNQYLRCGGSKFRMFVLARCDANGRNIYFLSANNEADYVPTFMPDGRVLYTRWEYVDREVFNIQSLWTSNPDGTALNVFWGNQSRWPDMVMNARPIPGSAKVLFSAVGHHDVYAGTLGVINQTEGLNYPDGVYNLTPNVPWAEVGKGPADKVYNPGFISPACYKAYQTPVPMSPELLLVSARTGTSFGTAAEKQAEWFRLYLMDYDGNMELLFKGAYNILHAQPIRKRALPRVIPNAVRWPGKMRAPDQQPESGVLYSEDVYEGSGIPRGLVKALRVLEVESQTYGDGKRSTHSEVEIYRKKGAIPETRLFGETAVSLIYDEGTKRVLGTVPVGEDGSVSVKVPPVRSVYFQLLDEKGRCLQTMRSFTHVMPGEVRGCVGCHETRPVTASTAAYKASSKRAPAELKPPAWGDETVSFPRFVQPVLDRHCVRCHSGKEPKAGLDLTHRTEPGTLISWPYVRLVFGKGAKTFNDLPKTSVAGPIFPYALYTNAAVKIPTLSTVVPPLAAMSYRSPLIQIAVSGKHHDVKVTPEEEARLVAWVDTLCPYLGLEEILAQPDMPACDYFAQPVHKGLTYPALMRTAPVIHRAFCQDDFKTQADRLPKAEDGTVLPSMTIVNGKRVYQIPPPK